MWLKKIRRRKLQSAFIVLIVMVCAMLMTSSLVIMTSWQEPYEDLSQECGSPNVKLYLYEKTKENATAIRDKFNSIEGVRRAQIIEYRYVREGITVQTKNTTKPMDYYLDTIRYNEDLHSKIRIIEGDINKLSDQGCFIPATIANEENIKVGDKIGIKDEFSLIVEGIYTDPYNMSISFDTEFIVREIPQDYEHEFYVAVFTKDNVSGNDVIEKYRIQNNGILEGRAITLEERIANNQMTDKILGGILLAMSFVILLVSGVMIRYMVKNMLISDNKTIAVYKTIGYQNKIIIRIYLKLYTSLVLIGGVLGAFLSQLVSNAFTRFTFKNLGVTGSSSVLVAGAFCVTVIVLFVMLCVYLVVKKTKSIRPIEVFQQTTVKASKKMKASKKITNFSPIQMALRMMNRDKKNTIIIVLTCMMSAYCVNFAATAFPMIQGMQDKNYYWIGFDKHDVSMEYTASEGYDESIQKISEMEEVKRIIPTSTDEVLSLAWEPGMVDTILSIMLYDSFEDLDISVLEGRNPRYSNEIAIGNSVAKQMKKHVGDYIDVYFQGDKKVSLLICGTLQSFYDLGRSCRLLGSTLTENGVDFTYQEASIYLNKGYPMEKFLDKANVEFNNQAKFIDRRLKYDNIMNMITGPQIQAIGPFVILALLLGGLNIVAIVYLKNKDSKKTYSIYKAIGYSSRHLMKVNFLYILIIALASLLITVPLFIFSFPKMMVLAMSFLGFKEYVVTYDVLVLILSNAGALLVYLASGLLTSKSLYENPISDLTCE